MNKSELIDIVAERLSVSKKAASDVVEAVLDEITRSVSGGEKVSISGFGVFEKQDRAARVGRNPRTGAAVKIKATSVPKFRAGADFKLVVAGKKRPATAKKAAAKKAPARKVAVKKAPARKAAPAKRVAKAAPARTTAARKASVKKAAPAKRAVKTTTTARKAPAKRTPAKKTAAKR